MKQAPVFTCYTAYDSWIGMFYVTLNFLHDLPELNNSCRWMLYVAINFLDKREHFLPCVFLGISLYSQDTQLFCIILGAITNINKKLHNTELVSIAVQGAYKNVSDNLSIHKIQSAI